MSMDIRKFLKLLDQYSIDYKDPKGTIKQHWLLPEKIKKHKKSGVIKELFLALGVDEVKHGNYRAYPSRTCPKNCVCPDCYRVALYNKKETNNKISSEDLAELVEDIDFNRCFEIGKKKYLNEYNNLQPDFLKITEKELDVAISFYKKGVKNGFSK